METSDDKTQTTQTQAQTTPDKPQSDVAETTTMLAAEMTRLTKASDALTSKLAEAEARTAALESELGAVRSAAQKGRIVNAIAGDFATPRVALEALVEQRFVNVAKGVERPAGATDAAHEEALAKAMREHLSGIEGGALLRRPTTAGGNDVDAGGSTAPMRSGFGVVRVIA